MNGRTLMTMVLALILAFCWAPAAPAADHSGMHGMTGHGGGHEAMAGEEFISLGEQTVEGITASAQLNDVRQAMAAAGMEATHHLMVFFTGEGGAMIESGVVAVKVTSPDGLESKAMPLQGMGGHFGADLQLAQTGDYRFAVGTRLADGKTRQFVFTATVH